MAPHSGDPAGALSPMKPPATSSAAAAAAAAPTTAAFAAAVAAAAAVALAATGGGSAAASALLTAASSQVVALQDLAPLLAPAALLLLLLLLVLLQWWRVSSALDLYKIPKAPTKWPFLGLLPDYWRGTNVAALQLRYFEAARAGPILRTRAAHKVVVLVADPAAAREVLSRSGADAVPRKAPEYSVFDLATGLNGHHSILTEQDEARWTAVRKALAPAYSAAAVKEAWPHIIAAYKTMGARIAAAIDNTLSCSVAADEKTLLQPSATATAAAGLAPAAATASDNGRNESINNNTAGGDKTAGLPPVDRSNIERRWADVHVDRLALGASVQLQLEGLFRMGPEARATVDELQIADDLESVIEVVHSYAVAPWERLLHFAFPWGSGTARAMHAARRRLGAAYERIYAAAVEGGPPPADGDLSLRACLRRLRDPTTGLPPSRERLVAEVGNQIMAPETAAHTLSWLLFCLATHPDWQSAVVSELPSIGLSPGAPLITALATLEAAGPGAAGPGALPALHAALAEAMRMFPAGASASPRLTERPTRVGPYLVPAGVMVFPCLYCIHNYSGNWERPEEFLPERWLSSPLTGDPTTGSSPALDPATGAPRFLPFSSGPKACIGEKLGMVAVATAAAALLTAFEFRLSDRMGSPADVAAHAKLALTLKADGGMWLRCSRRVAEAARAPAGGADEAAVGAKAEAPFG